jgi:predicted permease
MAILDSFLQDARCGLRQLRKTPALTLAVVVSLTIGVGANTAIFSLVDAALLKPLPVADPEALVIIEWTHSGFPDGVENINGDFNRLAAGRVRASSIGANLYRRLAREQHAFDTLLGVADPNPVAMAVDRSPAEQVSLQYVSSNFFQALGVPVAGRPFRDDDDRVGQAPVAIVSHRYWTRQLGASKNALDQIVRINNVPARVIGVAPRDFFGLRAGQWTDVYAPLAMRVAFQPSPAAGAPRGENDRDWWVRQVGRLKRGAVDDQARTQIAALFRTLAPVELITSPGSRGFDALNPRDANALWILMMLVGVLLLIVCANVANLLLSRSVGRQRESAVRLALGASRTRLWRQQFIESGLLALLGGAAGLAAGYLLAQSIHVLFEAGRGASSAFDLHVDVRMLAYTAALSIVATFLFGLAPAVWSSRADLNDALKAQSRSVMGGTLRLPRLLVSIQIALCLTALIAAGLLTRSLQNLKWIDVGFDRENLAYASVNPGQAGYSTERIAPYVNRVRDALAALPGVVSVSPIEIRLLSGNGNISRVSIPGRTSRIERGVVNDTEAAFRNSVGDGLFDTLRIPIVAGRSIEARDILAKADVAVVDDRFARRFFPDVNPVGRRFGFGDNENTRFEIIGVAGDSRYNSLRADARPTIFQPYVADVRRPVHFAIRTTIDSARLAEAVRKTVTAIDPAVPLTEFHTQTALIDRLLRTERLLGFISGAFGVVALTLAAVGLGGLLAYAVARRTNEIGIRMALGAASRQVTAMVLRESLGMVATGIVIGLPCAYAVGRILKTLLFQLEPLDPRTAAFSLSMLLITALAAAWLPARRAAGIDPMVALREE